MSMITPMPIVQHEPAIARRLAKFDARERRRKLLHKIIWTVPATLGILLFVVYTETSDTALPGVAEWLKKRRARVRAWWMSTFHDDRRG